MSPLKSLWGGLRALLRRNQVESEMDEELRGYLDAAVKANMRAGMSQEKALRAARVEMGSLDAVKEEIRTVGWESTLEALWQDIRYGLRQLKRNPSFTAVAVLTLALGIGSNTAIFTLINAVMLQNLPVKDPGQLVIFYTGISNGIYTGDALPGDIFSYQSWEYFRDHNEAFASLCAFKQGSDRLIVHLVGTSDAGPREDARGHLVSGSYFNVLGVRAAMGRMLSPEDDTPAAPPAAVISYNFWRRRFNLDRSVIGKAVELNGTVFTIVGVAPKEFFGERVETPPDFWLPLANQAHVMERESLLTRRDAYWLNLIGRLKPGVTMKSAQAVLNTQLHQFYTAQEGAQLTSERQLKIQKSHIQLSSGAGGISWMRSAYSEPLHILAAVVALVLLIACANVATLLLARASAREQEWFMRLALGAGRARLIRQLLTESILLSLFGAAAGVLLAGWSVKILVVMVRITSVVQVQPNLLVLGFTLAISILTGILFGVIPALRSSRVDLKLGGHTRSWASRSRFKPARALVVLQVALSLILLAGAALLTHSLLNLEWEDLGFHRENLLMVRTDPRLAGYQPAQLFPLYRQIQDKLDALPGVVSASIARYTPLSGSSSSSGLSIEGYTSPAGKEMNVYGVEVGPRFFETLGIPLLLGRTIGKQDTPATPMVAVVNESFVKRYLANQNPIGRHFVTGSPFKPPGTEIIGVVADAKYYDAREMPKPMAFFSAWQGGGYDAYVGELMVRTSGDPAGAAEEVRQAVNEIDSRLPILSVGTLYGQIYDSLDQERMITRLCGFFGILALLLACIGLYGTMSYSVAQRTNEIGIRMALGAKRTQVLWMVLHESIVLVGLGLAFGLPLAAVAARSIKSFLFGLPPVDAFGIGAAIVALTTVSALAGYLPARRATKVDPMVALRYE